MFIPLQYFQKKILIQRACERYEEETTIGVLNFYFLKEKLNYSFLTSTTNVVNVRGV